MSVHLAAVQRAWVRSYVTSSWRLAAYRNPAAVQYAIAKSEQGPYGVDSPYVDGTFSDDVMGKGGEGCGGVV